MVLWLGLPRTPLTPPWSPIFLRKPTHSTDYNPNFFVRSLATASHSSCRDFCCDRNTNARMIQIEENPLSLNSFIVKWKERYLIPHVIVVSITMPIAAPNGGVPSLSLYYLQASRHELRCIRVT